MSIINVNCRHHLADFFRRAQNTSARWFSIVRDEGSTNGAIGNLSSFVGMSYNDLYLPLMFSCGLIRQHTCNFRKTTTLNPSIDNGAYTWNDFFVEFSLDLEVFYLNRPNAKGVRRKYYFIRVGKFRDGVPRFTVLDQIRSNTKVAIKGVRRAQERLIESFARETPSSLNNRSHSQTDAREEAADATAGTEIESQQLAASTYTCNTNQNLRLIVQNHFFDGILKPGVDKDMLWNFIDESKLRDGISKFVTAFHAARYDSQQKVMPEALRCTSSDDENISLMER